METLPNRTIHDAEESCNQQIFVYYDYNEGDEPRIVLGNVGISGPEIEHALVLAA